MRIPPLRIKRLLESKPSKSQLLVGGLGVLLLLLPSLSRHWLISGLVPCGREDFGLVPCGKENLARHAQASAGPAPAARLRGQLRLLLRLRLRGMLRLPAAPAAPDARLPAAPAARDARARLLAVCWLLHARSSASRRACSRKRCSPRSRSFSYCVMIVCMSWTIERMSWTMRLISAADGSDSGGGLPG